VSYEDDKMVKLILDEEENFINGIINVFFLDASFLYKIEIIQDLSAIA